VHIYFNDQVIEKNKEGMIKDISVGLDPANNKFASPHKVNNPSASYGYYRIFL